MSQRWGGGEGKQVLVRAWDSSASPCGDEEALSPQQPEGWSWICAYEPGRGWDLPSWGRIPVRFPTQIRWHGAKRIRAPAGSIAGRSSLHKAARLGESCCSYETVHTVALAPFCRLRLISSSWPPCPPHCRRWEPSTSCLCFCSLLLLSDFHYKYPLMGCMGGEGKTGGVAHTKRKAVITGQGLLEERLVWIRHGSSSHVGPLQGQLLLPFH